MDTKETTKLYKSDTILLSDSNYYKFIFKKTEKIVCAVFYVLEHTDKSHNDRVAVSLLESAKHALDCVLQTLSCRWYTAYNELYLFLNTLIVLESNVRVAQAVALFQEEIADMICLEIDMVIRTLRQYLAYEKTSAPDLSSFSTDMSSGRRAMPHGGTDTITATPKKTFVSAKGQSKGQNTERRRMIKDILVSNRQSTIKDIVSKIPNWSEKTLQRDITDMINDGSIVKDGERRWSRYSLALGV